MAKTVAERVRDLEKANETLRKDLTESHLDAETRAAALQYMVAQLFRQLYVIAKVDDEFVADSHKKVREIFRKFVYKETNDPTFNDHISAEIETCVNDIINDVEELRNDYKRRGLGG